MPRGTHPNSLANLNRFSASRQPANPGRKPSKLRKFIKENNISREDVGAMIRNVLFTYTEDQLHALEYDTKKPMIIRLFVRAFRADWQRGSLQNFATFMDRAYGAPKMELGVSGGLAITALSPEERRSRIAELLAQLDFNRQNGGKALVPREAQSDAQTDSPDPTDSEPLAPQ